MNFAESITPSSISLLLRGATKAETISELVDILARSFAELDEIRDDILNAVIQREALQPTGIENGLAVPHAKVKGISRFYSAIGIHKGGVDFGAADSSPSKIIILLISPIHENVEHVKILSQIAKFTKSQSTVSKIMECKSPKEIYELVNNSMMINTNR